ncbi:AAA domain-containing protein [Aestuariibaculum sp. M13]|uniref:AAA domain-containing protein n=1 Tax=Aestuariibaculum sp. M13 TaxID=2967132 RepID=UPI002159F1BD|nr:AAA domain-containing protein [Aestuariibaculum sp. M13]MCR8666224.1 AAA domain-containing protein [Aestuariibaculum sp. M13]
MEITRKLIEELQNRLKVGNRRGVHLNAIPSGSRYKFDIHQLAHINPAIPSEFIENLLTQSPLKYRISWKDNVPDLNELFVDDQKKLVAITKTFDNLVNQTDAIFTEKGVNTFGFGFPLIARIDEKDKKLTVAPVLIWSLKIKRTKEFNTWEISRTEDDAIYINEVLINHLYNDSKIQIDPVSSDYLDDGIIDKDELIEICADLLQQINSKVPENIKSILKEKLENIESIPSKKHFESLPLAPNNSLITFSGLFSIFEVQKQNVIKDYDYLLELEGLDLVNGVEGLADFQSLSSVKTDPSQQGILNAIESKRNILIQGPPGTGKSQSLTAVLVNALENRKKIIVVCEKQTALDVLYKQLEAIGLDNHAILIKDIIRDRKIAVKSIRERSELLIAKPELAYSSKSELNRDLKKANELISKINKRHLKINETLVNSLNWTQTVGFWLKHFKELEEEEKLTLSRDLFSYNSKELNEILDVLENGEPLYKAFKPNKELSFLNPEKFIGDSPYQMEDDLKDVFERYEAKLGETMKLVDSFRIKVREVRNLQFETSKTKILDDLQKIEANLAGIPNHLDKVKPKFVEIYQKGLMPVVQPLKSDVDELNQFYQNWDVKYKEFYTQFLAFRKNEINTQWQDIKALFVSLDQLYLEVGTEQLFLDDNKRNSFITKLKSKLSSKVKAVVDKVDEIQKLTDSLARQSASCIDFDNFNTDISALKTKLAYDAFKKQSETIFNNSPKSVESEFETLNFKSFFEDDISNPELFSNIEQKINSFSCSNEYKEYLEDINNVLKESQANLMSWFSNIDSAVKQIPFFENTNWADSIKDREADVKKLTQQLANFEEEAEKQAVLKFDQVIVDLDNTYVGLPKVIFKLKNVTKNAGQSTYKLEDNFWQKLYEHLKSTRKECTDLFSGIAKELQTSRNFTPFSFHATWEKMVLQIESFKTDFDIQIKAFPDKLEKALEGLNFLDDKQTADFEELNVIQNNVIELIAQIKQDNLLVKQINKGKIAKNIIKVSDVIGQFKAYSSHDDALFLKEFGWLNFYNNQSESLKFILNQLSEHSDWRSLFISHYLNNLLSSKSSSELPTNDQYNEDLSKVLSKFGQKQIDYVNSLWNNNQSLAIREFTSKNRTTGLNISNLYNLKRSKNFDRLSLRNIIKYDIDFFTDFFPIILTTPDICSNLFQERNKYFDIVMFDEASQLKLEDNLPALLKGKKVIVAGDEHQMPPSNYFTKLYDGSINDEDDLEDEDEVLINSEDIALSCESLLEFAEQLSFEKKYLDFHYRSQHPYLIDFSNHAFYNKRLIPLPNKVEYKPINFIQVDGVYSDNSNEREAEVVLSIIENNIHQLPDGSYPSVGIATFNISQRNLILNKITERKKLDKHKAFNQKIEELEANGLFVKNLENIQGDERDVIILSTTYGRNPDNVFRQSFGPINHKKGYKLLNVIVTRAKHKIYLCTSIPEDAYLDYKSYLVTEGDNNRKAALYAYLAYARAVSNGDEEARLNILTHLTENVQEASDITYHHQKLESPFEEEVYDVLVRNFGEDKIIPQYKFAGFRIDLVYQSKNPALPKIAIECDGAAYHSSNEAYLYDRHRQKILENHGFVFHRIFSTNWWRNVKREKRKLIEFIESIEKGNPNLVLNFDDPTSAFTDEIKHPIHEIKNLGKQAQINYEEVLNDVVTEVIEEPKVKTNPVKENSIVVINYINSNKEIKLQLVEDGYVQPTTTNGVMKINYKAPIGQALLGKTEGEMVKIGKLDNYVEILQIVNKN